MEKMKRETLFLLTAILAFSFCAVASLPASAHYPGADIICPRTMVVPAIDGVFSAGEWTDASATPVEFRYRTDENLTGIFYAKYDQNNLYVALVIDDPGDAEVEDEFWLEFDEAHTGTLSIGDAGVATWGNGTCLPFGFRGDSWYNGADWDNDTYDYGDFFAAASINGDTHVWELAIPFDLGDLEDLDITPTPGRTIGLNLQYFDNTTAGDGLYNGKNDGYDDWPDERVENDSPWRDPSRWASLTFGAEVPEFNTAGLLGLIGILSVVLAVTVRKRG
jgi:hypothetical protein